MKTANLKNGMICVSVPSNSFGYEIKNNTLITRKPFSNVETKFDDINLDDYQILGTITKDECSFDCSDYVESWSKNYGELHFKDYKDETRFFINSIGSFKSMIEAETKFLFENNKPHPSDIEPTNRSHYDKITEEWHQHQSRVIEKLLILKTI
jgi:hypothetical protein